MVLPPKQKTETVELAGFRFILNKLDPEAGSFWAFRLLGELLASGLVGADGAFNLSGIIAKVESFTKMDRVSFKEFRRDCLGCVLVDLPSGATPIMNSTGHVVVDVPVELQFLLIIRAFMFTLMDFFSLADSMGLQQTNSTPSPSENASSTPPSSMDSGVSMNYGMGHTPPPIG